MILPWQPLLSWKAWFRLLTYAGGKLMMKRLGIAKRDRVILAGAFPPLLSLKAKD